MDERSLFQWSAPSEIEMMYNDKLEPNSSAFRRTKEFMHGQNKRFDTCTTGI